MTNIDGRPENEEKEFVYLPVSLARKIKDLGEGKVYEGLVLDYLNESKNEIKANLASLDDDVIRYKGLMIKAKQAFKEAKDEEIKNSYEMWESLDKELPSLKEKVESMKQSLLPLQSTLKEINSGMEVLRTYQIKELLEIVKEISQELSYDSKTGKILKFLVANYKD